MYNEQQYGDENCVYKKGKEKIAYIMREIIHETNVESMKFGYYFDIKSVLSCLLKMYKYFDKNKISKLIVNTLL